MSVPQVMIDAAAEVLVPVGSRSASEIAERAIRAALAAAPTEPAAWGVESAAEGIVDAAESRPAAEKLCEEIAGAGDYSAAAYYGVVPLFAHPPVPDGETARLRVTDAMRIAAAEAYPLAHAAAWQETRSLSASSVRAWTAALEAALSVGDTTGKCHNAVIAVDALLPESGEERDALVEVMQDAIFEAFDIDSGAREFAHAAYDELRSVLMTEGEGPANTTEEQG